MPSNRFQAEAKARNQTFGSPRPPRRGSLRRSSSHQSIWSPGDDSRFRMVSRARDLLTQMDGVPVELGEDCLDAQLDVDGRILAMTGSVSTDRLERFVGLRPGGQLRKVLATDMPEEEQAETRLFRLLDDLAGALFMSIAGWYGWEGGIEGHAARTQQNVRTARKVEGVCLSYVPGSPAMTSDGRGIDARADHPVAPTALPVEDPSVFHPLVEIDAPNEWRLRCTDIWREGREYVVDAWFQDSSSLPGDLERRLIFHEYGILARFEAESLELREITVKPYVLPYVTCHAAPATAQALLGHTATDLRQQVLAQLRGTAGCTHLNDMLRALQDVAGLAGLLADNLAPDTSVGEQGSTAD